MLDSCKLKSACNFPLISNKVSSILLYCGSLEFMGKLAYGYVSENAFSQGIEDSVRDSNASHFELAVQFTCELLHLMG